MIEIKNINGDVIYTHKGANLDGADLRFAILTGANLDGADLRFANLNGAYLSRANNLDGAKIKRSV
jgi:uncharacterized protein YjbI with pentapeptide repeats